ncbi:MAG: hypothetical protein ACRCWS_06005, partial [Propionibacteriaceae bacterium]
KNADDYSSALLSSYRLANGVLHNPANDRRTTAGVFHIAEGGLPISDDKLTVPVEVFARLLAAAFQPPQDLLELPYTSTQENPAACFVSLYLQPLVAPEVPGFRPEQVMETRFIVPGGLVCNLDFVETIFGNAGDPSLLHNDLSTDPVHWTGTTGLVVLAPHLTSLTKKELGLPHRSEATALQQRDGMCWDNPDELYNGGSAFKVCARDESGVMVTVIADNYFGYCKKEVKTQISYSANLIGLAEEEHSGGAIAYPAWNLTTRWHDSITPPEFSVADVIARDPDIWDKHEGGYATLRDNPNLVLVPGGADYTIRTQSVQWENPDGTTGQVTLLAGKTYITPSGYRVHAKARDADPKQWHLIGTSPDATSMHKPATVSGGGKSEISKSLLDAFVFDHAFTPAFDSDMDAVEALITHDYRNRFRDPSQTDERSLLSPERSLGSVIKLFTPSSSYTDDYNAWLRTIPSHVLELCYIVKRYYRVAWGTDWRSHFSVSSTNGRQGTDLKLDGDNIIVNMLRVGFEEDGSWRLFSLRPDFSPAAKVQTEDDITASIVAPTSTGSAKYVGNCERYLFQRPDDAIHRGYDAQAERDLATPDTFISNFHPMTREQARTLVANAPAFAQFTEPQQASIAEFAAQSDDQSPQYLVVSSEPRIVNGARTKNPRYLQLRPDLTRPELTHAADVASHLWAKTPLSQPLPLPIGVVAAGRRNNPAEDGVPPLCAYNPLHYMELPELLMEFASSMTGKSPSTTGAGSEGAMTKGPFNALPPVIDLNAALLCYALTDADGWLSSAGVIGPKMRVNHDISLLIPELFSRMGVKERRAARLIESGYLEKVDDFTHNGRTILASRLGYRMNEKFVTTYFARIFLHPDVVFTDAMLKPELQGLDDFAESVAVIVETHRRVAQSYLDDGTIALAVPPLRALLEIMALGESSEGWTLTSPEFREQFTREAILSSDWYAQRLAAQQQADVARLSHGMDVLTPLAQATSLSPAQREFFQGRLVATQQLLEIVAAPQYQENLAGTLGRQEHFDWNA